MTEERRARIQRLAEQLAMAEDIHTARKSLGATWQGLAAACGTDITQATVKRCEDGKGTTAELVAIRAGLVKLADAADAAHAARMRSVRALVDDMPATAPADDKASKATPIRSSRKAS
ncbi:hypothetical protein SAMN05421678_108251 [Actinopolymorpha cephalotaxi]|uniref:Transcriptional regulator n=1 Tax=Actinopolymorpha cephalotaxi TaxID=504797 RepID=A0A1I2UQN1_9ACTN|nr:hypothetical protein [Actinopolymorpha cephalotaxi]NYH86665.1 putative transcriptional regulator [Actinopolymorpha cephalotaxi]SFG78569.1 hypothetical protein SAMN05421678_108251 [Actinopolymorpha cephalotaxi]